MAFQTIPGTGGAPDSYVGTSGVDSVAITNNNNAVDLLGYDSNDAVTIVNALGVVNAYTLRGGSGNDAFTSTLTTIAGNSFFNGNAGNDVITLNAFNGVSVTSSAIRGGQGNDTIALTGSLNGSLLNGNLDDDTITTAGSSNSSIFGGRGVDTLFITGATVLTNVSGDRDNDTITIGANAGGNVATNLSQSSIFGGHGNDTINITAGVTASTDTSIYGGDGNDRINAAAATVALRVFGEDGDDTINGSTGGGILNGGAGADTITANGGATTIVGGTGADQLTAGAGVDTFVFAAGDSFATTGVTGATATFTNGVDTLVDVITGFSAANDFFSFSTVPSNLTEQNGLGANAIIQNGRVLLSPNANELSGNIRVYVGGSNTSWNQQTGIFTYAAGAQALPADFMVFQINLATPIAAGGSTQTDITAQFNLAEAVIFNNMAA